MPYANIENDQNGVVHEYRVPELAMDTRYTTCGKKLHSAWETTEAPVTCKKCLQTIRAGWDYRQLRDLKALAQEITYEADGYVLPDRLTEIIGQFENVLNRKQPA